MQYFEVLLRLDLGRALHDYWRNSSPEPHIIVGAAGVGGQLAHVDWAAFFSLVALFLMIIGGSIIQLYKQARICLIEIREAQRLADHRVAAEKRAIDSAAAGRAAAGA
jgi:hypothetical protein